MSTTITPRFARRPSLRLPLLRLGSIPEHHESEYDLPALNLGAETPSPWSATAHTLNDADDDEWAKLRAALQSHVPVPTRRTLWRSSSFTRKNRSWIDGDCGICFEAAVNPCRTLCCNKVFCKEHLTDVCSSYLFHPNVDRIYIVA